MFSDNGLEKAPPVPPVPPVTVSEVGMSVQCEPAHAAGIEGPRRESKSTFCRTHQGMRRVSAFGRIERCTICCADACAPAVLR